jgi:hypothetical protein
MSLKEQENLLAPVGSISPLAMQASSSAAVTAMAADISPLLFSSFLPVFPPCTFGCNFSFVLLAVAFFSAQEKR